MLPTTAAWVAGLALVLAACSAYPSAPSDEDGEAGHGESSSGGGGGGGGEGGGAVGGGGGGGASLDVKAELTVFIDDVGARGVEPDNRIFRTQEEYRAFAGHDAPALVDFSKEWVVFYGSGAPKASFEAAIDSVEKPAGSSTLEVKTSRKPKGACWVVGSLYALAKFPKVPAATEEHFTADEQPSDNCDVAPDIAANWSCDFGGGDPLFVDKCFKTGTPGALSAQTGLAWAKVTPAGLCYAALTCPDGARLGCEGEFACASTPSKTEGWVVCDGKRTACSQDTAFAAASGPSKPEAQGWQLTFGDEFDGGSIDGTRWTHDYLGFDADHVFLQDGKAVFRIDEDDPLTPWGSHVSSLNTRDIFAQQYGWFEIRAKLANGDAKGGGLSTFWLLPEDGAYLPSVAQGGFRPSNEAFEIDIFEQQTGRPKLNTYTMHAGNNPDFIGPDTPGDHVEGYITQDYPFDHSAAFHTYAIEWSPERVTWYIDNREVQHSELAPRSPFFIHVDLYHDPNGADPALPLPLEYEVDYVRVYRLPGT